VNVLITGGCGFIGSNLIRYIRRERSAWRVVNLDLLTYAADPRTLAGVAEDRRYRFVRGDVADRALLGRLVAEEQFDAAVHCAAESHVDRSLQESGVFLRTNVEGTLVMVEAALEGGLGRHVQMSTDEVYGSLRADDPRFTEATPLAPRSPYSASKAAGDQLALAFHHSHGLDVVVTRCSNNYGPYQHPEKLIPLMITAALRGLRLPVYGDGRQRRDWIHVEDHCRGVLAALEHGRGGEVYNFGGGAERENLEVVRRIVAGVGADERLITHVADRPGHDRRYSIDFAKAERELGWRPSRSFEDGLAETIAWYRDNPAWWGRTAERSYEESRQRTARWAARSRPVASADEHGP
jgi:dTDP-glucose 4,6-dehydratase